MTYDYRKLLSHRKIIVRFSCNQAHGRRQSSGKSWPLYFPPTERLHTRSTGHWPRKPCSTLVQGRAAVNGNAEEPETKNRFSHGTNRHDVISIARVKSLTKIVTLCWKLTLTQPDERTTAVLDKLAQHRTIIRKLKTTADSENYENNHSTIVCACITPKRHALEVLLFDRFIFSLPTISKYRVIIWCNCDILRQLNVEYLAQHCKRNNDAIHCQALLKAIVHDDGAYYEHTL